MIGLIPCAGRAERLHGLPKYLLPLPDGYLLKNICDLMQKTCREVVVLGSQVNREFLRQYMPTDIRKWPPPIACLPVFDTRSMVETILTIENLEARDSNDFLMAMPDTYWTPEPDLFPQMAQLLDVSDVVLAVWQFRDSQRGHLGAVDLDGTTVREVVDKDPFSPHQFFWGAMAWKPGFWDYMKPEQTHLGIAVNSAIADGLHVRAVIAEGQYYDCGIWSCYAELCRALTEKETL